MRTEQPDGEEPDPDLEVPQAGGIILRMLLGTQLRRLREAADVTPERAPATRSGRPGQRSAGWRPGHVGFKTRDVTDLLSIYGVTDAQVRDRLLAMARQSSRDWWAQFSDILPGWF